MGRSNKGKHFLDHNKLVRWGDPENFKLSTGPNPEIGTLSGISTESLPDLGLSLPSTVGQKSFMKCLPNVGRIYDQGEGLYVKSVACHFGEQRMLQPSSHQITAVPDSEP